MHLLKNFCPFEMEKREEKMGKSRREKLSPVDWMPVAPCSCLSALIDLERFPFFLFKRKRKRRREEFVAFLVAPEKEKWRRIFPRGVLCGDQHIWGPRLENKAAEREETFQTPRHYWVFPSPRKKYAGKRK